MEAKGILVRVLMSVPLLIMACNDSVNNRIGLQLYEGFDVRLADTVKRAIEDVYGFEVQVRSSKPIPESAYINTKSPRYRADSLIRILSRNRPTDMDYLMGLTHKDISTTKTVEGKVKQPAYKYADWGIFGLGFRPGPTSVVSTYRLQHQDHAIFLERLKKVSVHELGHNLGLSHCNTSQCVMQDAAESIRTIDELRLQLCKHCRQIVR